jgi:hypothetical protein
MKHCVYFIDLNGDEETIRTIGRFIPRQQKSLAEARERARAILLLFGSVVNVRIIVRRQDIRATTPRVLRPM